MEGSSRDDLVLNRRRFVFLTNSALFREKKTLLLMKSASIFIEKKYIKFQSVNAKNALSRKLRRKADAKVSPSITE